MSAKVLAIGADDAHQGVQALLPWYLSGGLDPAEVDVLEAHLSGCARCQAELAWERSVQAARAAPAGDAGHGDVERGWARLRARIEASERAASTGAAARPAPAPARLHVAMRRWRALAAAQFAAIGALAALLLWLPAHDERYHALGAASPAPSGNLIVRFRPETPERELRGALAQAGARLVDGPTVTDAYLLEVPAARQAAALAALRAQPSVVLAESLR